MNQRDIHESLNNAALSVLTNNASTQSSETRDYTHEAAVILTILEEQGLLLENPLLLGLGAEAAELGLGAAAAELGLGTAARAAAAGAARQTAARAATQAAARAAAEKTAEDLAKQAVETGVKKTIGQKVTKFGKDLGKMYLVGKAGDAALDAGVNMYRHITGSDRDQDVGPTGPTDPQPSASSGPKQPRALTKGPFRYTAESFTHLLCTLIEHGFITGNQAYKLLTLDESAASSAIGAAADAQLNRDTIAAIEKASTKAAEKAAKKASRNAWKSRLGYGGGGLITGGSWGGNEYAPWRSNQYGEISPWEHSSTYHVGYYPGVQPGAFAAGVAAGSAINTINRLRKNTKSSQ